MNHRRTHEARDILKPNDLGYVAMTTLITLTALTFLITLRTQTDLSLGVLLKYRSFIKF